jgi:hypothetical protein
MASAVQTIQTPSGDFKYMFITGQGRLKPRSKDQYSYSACVILDKKEGKKLYEEICDFFNENKPKKCKLDEPENNIYTKLDDGRWMFQFRTNTEFTDKKGNVKPNQVKVFNAKNIETPLPEGVMIGEGSRGSILGALQVHEGDTPSEAGCSMFLNGIRIGKFVAYEGGVEFDGEEEGDFTGFGNPDYPDEESIPKKDKKKAKKSRDEDEDDEDEDADEKPKSKSKYADLEKAIDDGNHKKAKTLLQSAEESMDDDVYKSFKKRVKALKDG